MTRHESSRSDTEQREPTRRQLRGIDGRIGQGKAGKFIRQGDWECRVARLRTFDCGGDLIESSDGI